MPLAKRPQPTSESKTAPRPAASWAGQGPGQPGADAGLFHFSPPRNLGGAGDGRCCHLRRDGAWPNAIRELAVTAARRYLHTSLG